MSKFSFVKNISLLIALVVVVYLVANNAGLAQQIVLSALNMSGSSVKGASTVRAEELSEKFKSDMQSQVEIAKDYVLHLTLSDAINGFSRLQKVPQDVHSLQEFTKEQIDTMVKSKAKN